MFFKRLWRAMKVYNLPYENKPPYTHFVQIGDPILRTPSASVSRYDIHMDYVQETVKMMKKNILKSGLVGLSACQIGVRLRIIALNIPQKLITDTFTPEERDAIEIEPVPLQIWMNPVMTVLDRNTRNLPEQCASINSFCAHVKRYRKVSLAGMDENGNSKSMIASGWTARVIQHEMDHLDGIVYTDVMDPKTLQCTLWKQVNECNGHIEILYYPKV